jgi:acetylornithine aminotransferase
VLISSQFEAKHGLLGTTFGGNYLACAAAIAVLDIIKEEALIVNAQQKGNYLIENLKKISSVKEVRGMGLMIGVEFNVPVALLRNELLFNHKIFTGSASNKNTLRLLPPLNITEAQCNFFLNALKDSVEKLKLA